MPIPKNTASSRYTTESLSLSVIGALSCLAVAYAAARTPEWYSYLNWKPGLASLFVERAKLIAALFTAVVAMRMVLAREPAYALLGVACIIGALNAQDIARHIGYSTGVAKVECWSPDTRECLLGKFERIEKLKNPVVPVVLTDKEKAVFTAFKATRASFEASKPKGLGDDFKKWAQDYRKALDHVFAGYPSAFPG